MISFIVIGRNEGWKLSLSVESVFNAINANAIKEFEVIYIDSNSSDDSIDRAKKFEQVKIIKLTGVYNAAIARNIGVEESKGNILFFIDGDMEILPEFLSKVYSEKTGDLQYPFISGQVEHYNYDENGNFIDNTWQYREVLKGDKFYTTTGGVFVIEKRLWLLVEGMDIRFRRGQDLDLALKLAQKGYKILRKKEIIARHHTISYTHQSRMWRTLLSGDISFSNSFLYRKHLLNFFVYKKILKTNYTLLALLSFPVIGILTGHRFIGLLYVLVVLAKSIKIKNVGFPGKIQLMLFYFVRDLFILFYFFTPIPKAKVADIKYELIE